MMFTFNTPTPITAVVEIPAGRVQVIAADRADTTVEVRPANPGKGRDVKLAGQITVDYGVGVLRVAGPAKNQYFGSTGAVEVTVQLPAGSRADVKAASAEFRTVGRLGQVTLDSAQATVNLDEAATAQLTTTDGTITIARLGGDADIRTARCDIHIDEAHPGQLTLRTAAGSITVTAASGVSASLDAGTSNGRIHNALHNTGTAELAIHATTATGDITARTR